MSEVVLRSDEEGVALLTLNRPDRLNAWTQEMERDYFAALDDCAADEDVRVIVVTGAGRGFCAGADMDDLAAIGSNGVGEARTDERRPQTFPLSIPRHSQLTPARLNRFNCSGWSVSTREYAQRLRESPKRS